MAAKDRKNSEGYSDPTAYAAMRNIARDEDRFRKLRKVILNICDVAGFEVRGPIILVDKKSGDLEVKKVTMEELVKAAEKVAEAWLAFGKQLKEAVDAVSEVFNAAFGSPELWPKKDGTTPKKYGMSLRKCQRRTSVHYHYIPTTPRNLPYMRRAY